MLRILTIRPISEKPEYVGENVTVLIHTIYDTTIIGEFDIRLQKFLCDGYRENEFVEWTYLPDWRATE